MPKENVYGDQPAFATPGEPGEVLAYSVVEVLWNREAEHVQLATKCLDAVTGDHFDPAEHSLEARVSEGVQPPSYLDGFYVDLNRRGINDLIRHLRRARDHAFGRDE